MNRLPSFSRVFLLILVSIQQAWAADGQDFFQAIGKMYVVVAVIVLIFLGITIYLYRMDRKVSELERKMNNE